MTDITLENVRKEFEDVVAVNSVELEVEDGEFIVLVGPSGCGKSTTLRCVSGLESITDGKILMGGEDVTSLEPRDRNVAMVFQNYALYPHMTASRNMSFGMQSHGDFSDEEVDERIAKAAETLDIEDLLDRKPAALSGGEQQRVAIGRALTRDPDILLMDEPLSNLDAKLRLEMRAELSKLHEELQTTTVYVTHDQTEAMTLGDRVAVMNAGSFEQVAEPQMLYDYPATQFVAEFIGEPAMNTVPVDVIEESGTYYATNEDVRVELHDTDGVEDLVGRELVLGVRPEDLYQGDETENNQVAATITVAEPLGDVLLLTGDVDTTVMKLQVDPRSEVSPGETVSFGVDLDRLHLFDPSDGRALYHSDRELDNADKKDQPSVKST